MIKKVLRVLFGVFVLNILTYFFFSEMATKKVVHKKYKEFTYRRLNNTWNVDTNEIVIVNSCGQEFFREMSFLEETLKESNPRFENLPQDMENEENFQYAMNYSGDVDILGEINARTDSLKSVTCIIYKVCTLETIPGFYKRISYQFFYSGNPTNFHNMRYTDQMVHSEPDYWWLLGFWIEVKGEIFSY